MERRELVDLLYAAHSRFKSIQLSWTYRYEEAVLRQLLENSSGQLLKRVASSPSDMPDHQQTSAIKTVQRRIWWQRPGRWREELNRSNTDQSVTIICDGLSWQYSTSAKILFTNVVHLQNQAFASYEIRNVEAAPIIEDVTFGIQLLDPSFLLASHELEVIGETTHAGREAAAVRGKYLKHRELLFEAFFWATADEYTFLVDRAYGILLRYAYILNGREIAVSSVDDVIFDQPIPANIFSPGPAAET